MRRKHFPKFNLLNFRECNIYVSEYTQSLYKPNAGRKAKNLKQNLVHPEMSISSPSFARVLLSHTE